MHIKIRLKKKQTKWTDIDSQNKTDIISDIRENKGRFPPFWCSVVKACVNALTEEEREQVERLRWPSRGYLQELSEYQQRRRKLRKSRCTVM